MITNLARIYQIRGAPAQKCLMEPLPYEVKILNRLPDLNEILCGESLWSYVAEGGTGGEFLTPDFKIQSPAELSPDPP